MATEFNTGSDASLNEAVKNRYEANSDTNALADAEKAVLSNMATSHILGRSTAGSGIVEVLTPSAVRGMIKMKVFVQDAGGNNAAARDPDAGVSDCVIWFNHGADAPANLGTLDIAAGLGQGVATSKDVAGAAHTLALADAGYLIRRSHTATNDTSIPTNAAAAFSINTVIDIKKVNDETTTVTAATGVTLNGTPSGSISIGGQYQAVSLQKVGTDAWEASGDFS